MRRVESAKNAHRRLTSSDSLNTTRTSLVFRAVSRSVPGGRSEARTLEANSPKRDQRRVFREVGMQRRTSGAERSGNLLTVRRGWGRRTFKNRL